MITRWTWICLLPFAMSARAEIVDRIVSTVGNQVITQSEIVREALRLLKEREELKRLRIAEIRKAIAIGSAEAERGEFIDGKEAFAAIRKRSAERKRDQR